jgi:hypothetical protein
MAGKFENLLKTLSQISYLRILAGWPILPPKWDVEGVIR